MIPLSKDQEQAALAFYTYCQLDRKGRERVDAEIDSQLCRVLAEQAKMRAKMIEFGIRFKHE